MMILLGIMLMALGKSLGEYAELRRCSTTSIEAVGFLGVMSFVVGSGIIFIQLVDLFVIIKQWSYNV